MHNHLGKNPKIPQNTQNLLRNRVLLAKKCWVLNQNWHGQGFCDKENKSDIKIQKRSSTWQLWRHNHLGKTLKIPKNIRNWLFNRLLLAKKWWFLNENLYGQGFWGKENKSDIKIQNNKVFDSYNFIITWGKPLKYHKMHKIGYWIGYCSPGNDGFWIKIGVEQFFGVIKTMVT